MGQVIRTLISEAKMQFTDLIKKTLTVTQKRTALRNLVKAKILAMGLDTADEAWTDFITFVPPPFEVIVRDV